MVALLVAVVGPGPPLSGAQAAHPLDRFVTATLDRAVDHRDSLAQSFNSAQLPLLVASVAADMTLSGARLERLYAAFTRWHFWTGTRWDDSGQIGRAHV